LVDVPEVPSTSISSWFVVTILIFFSLHGINAVACSNSELTLKNMNFTDPVRFLGLGIRPPSAYVHIDKQK
jgi:hypothetical protein